MTSIIKPGTPEHSLRDGWQRAARLSGAVLRTFARTESVRPGETHGRVITDALARVKPYKAAVERYAAAQERLTELQTAYRAAEHVWTDSLAGLDRNAQDAAATAAETAANAVRDFVRDEYAPARDGLTTASVEHGPKLEELATAKLEAIRIRAAELRAELAATEADAERVQADVHYLWCIDPERRAQAVRASADAEFWRQRAIQTHESRMAIAGHHTAVTVGQYFDSDGNVR